MFPASGFLIDRLLLRLKELPSDMEEDILTPPVSLIGD